MAQMQQIVLNDRIDAVMAALFMLVVIAMLGFSLQRIWQSRALTAPHNEGAVHDAI